MIRTTTIGMMALALAAAGVAMAQGQPAGAQGAASGNEARDAAATGARSVPQLAQAARSQHAEDADARECLDYVTNVGIIRCAERYLSRRAAPRRR